MTVKEILAELESLGDQQVRARNKKNGAGDDQYGVKMGDIRTLAKRLKSNHELGLKLWSTGNLEARFLSTLLMKPRQLSLEDLDRMVREEQFAFAADWFFNYIIKEHPEKESLRLQWMDSDHPMAARAGWSLMAGRVNRDPEGIDISALLDRLEKQMPNAPEAVQWTMNATLAGIGINHPPFRQRALEIGERLGIYRDYPTSKGCTSPFAPIWINEMVRRGG